MGVSSGSRTLKRTLCMMALLSVGGAQARAADIIVAPGTATSTLTAALARAKPGDRIIVMSGRYAEAMVTITVPRLTIEGRDWPEFSGAGQHTVLVVAADSVTVRGLVLRQTGFSDLDDRAGILVRDVRGCLIEHNRFRDNVFGVYLKRATACVVRDNDVQAQTASQSVGGNGIHLWYSPNNRVERNRISGHRDGIYFEFSPSSVATHNTSSRNQRYGLHFMFSDSCRYLSNVFSDNRSGVAVMMSRGIEIRANRFERSRGAAAYGLLVKDIVGGEVTDNVFDGNSTGLHVEGSSRLEIRGNTWSQNGWAIRVLANAEDNRFTANQFVGNAFDVVTNSRSASSTFDRNWWDEYRGYDLDRDGIGDVPFRPVRLFALVVEQHPPALLLLRSPLVALLDAAERVVPLLTPDALVDRHPLMRIPR